MARSSACLDFLLLLFSSDSIAFPFYFFSFLPRLRGFVSPPDVHWRRNVCSRGGDVLSAVVGFIPIRGSNNDKRPVVGRTVATSTSRNLIRNGGLRTRTTFAGFMRCKRKSTGRASTTGGATVSNIPDYVRRNAVSVRKWRERLRSSPVSSTSPDLHVTIESEKTSIRIAHVSSTSRDIFVTLNTS